MVTINLNYSKLRGRIREKCGTEGAFAKSIGRSPKFISDVFQEEPTLTQRISIKQ